MTGCPRVLVIAGSDSGGGAGIQADVKTITMLGGHAMTAITALTAQNSLGVTGVVPVDPAFILAQIDAAVGDLGVDAVKIGMIGSAEAAHAIADRLAGWTDVPIVFDPVMLATSGAVLADADTVAAFDRLIRLATVATPNAAELSVLAGVEVATVEHAEAAAQAMVQRHGRAVLAKGGHIALAMEGSPLVRDQLVTREGTRRWTSSRIETRHTHGTGCTLASAIATGLGSGLPLEDAITRARSYLRAALKAAPGYGAGAGPIGHALGGVPWDAMRG